MKAQNYYFTFGTNTGKGNNFVKIHGTYGDARQKMVDRFGLNWAFQYDEQGFKGQQEAFGLTEITDETA